ncbi:hypothetical protein PsW64_03250 [Pseudovibrio sp. W64]|nr:hypothetical protein PsW64_03250 [Pseudovibrio sp. W64]
MNHNESAPYRTLTLSKATGRLIQVPNETVSLNSTGFVAENSHFYRFVIAVTQIITELNKAF